MLTRPHRDVPDPPWAAGADLELSRWREELLSLQPVSGRGARGGSEPGNRPQPEVLPALVPPGPALDLSRWREELLPL